MKKIHIFIFAFIAIFTQKGFSQSGIDFSLVPVDYVQRVDLGGDNRAQLYSGAHYGIKLGYFKWETPSIMTFISLQLTNFSKDFYTQNYDNGKFNNFTQSATSYLIKIGTMNVFNEIDYKSHIYLKQAFLIAMRSDKVNQTNTDALTNNAGVSLRYDDNKEDPVGFSLGYEAGMGYQYNVNKKLGVYADATLGVRSFEVMFFLNTNLGVRYRLR